MTTADSYTQLAQHGLSSLSFHFSLSRYFPQKAFPRRYAVVEAWRLQEFGFSREDFLPGLGQLESHQASADEGDEGQEDGDDLGDADEGCKDEAGDDGRKLANPIQDTERCPSAESKRQ